MVKSELDGLEFLIHDSEVKRFGATLRILKSVKRKAQEKETCEWTDVSYLFLRCVRGLGSIRESARHGYYSTLVALLSYIPESVYSFEEFQEVIDKELSIGRAVSNQEESEVLLGNALAYGALIQSGLYFREPVEIQQLIVTKLLHLSSKRSYLHPVVFNILIKLIHLADENFQVDVLSQLNLSTKDFSELSLDELYCILTCIDKFPNFKSSLACKKKIKLTSDSINDLIKIVLNTSVLMNYEHPCYTAIGKRLLGKSKLLEIFWKGFTNAFDGLSVARKRVVLSVLTKMLNLINEECGESVDSLINEPIIKWLMNTKNKNLADNQVEVLQSLFNACKFCDSKTKYKVIKKLLFEPGSLQFDQLAKTKLCKEIVHGMEFNELSKLAEELLLVIQGKNVPGLDNNNSWSNKCKVQAVYLYKAIITRPVCLKHPKWKIQQLTWLAVNGLVKSGPISVELAALIRNMFFSSLSSRFSSQAELSDALQSIVNCINGKLKQPLYVKPPTDSWHDCIKKLKVIDSQSPTPPSLIALKLLYLQVMLMLFSETKSAQRVILDLDSIYDRVISKKSVENDLPWIEVLTDLLLHLLSKESGIHRHLINTFFGSISGFLTTNAKQLIVSALENGMEGDKDIEVDGDDEDNDEDKGDDESEQSENDDSSSEDDSDWSEDEENIKPNDLFRQNVRQALYPEASSDVESVDLDDMDEDERSRLNASLGQLFKAHRGGSSKSAQTKRTNKSIEFRSKVLDLVDSLVESSPSVDFMVSLLPILHRLLASSIKESQPQFTARLTKTFKKLQSIKKFENIESVEPDVIIDLFKSLIISRSHSNSLSKFTDLQMSITGKLLMRAAMAISPSSLFPVLQEAVTDFFTQRSSLVPFSFLLSIPTLDFPKKHKLIDALIKLAFSKVIQSKKLKAFNLLNTFFKTNANSLNKHFNSLANTVLVNTLELLTSDSGPVLGLVEVLLTLHPKTKENPNWTALASSFRDSKDTVSKFVVSKNNLKSLKQIFKLLELDIDHLNEYTVKEGVKDKTENGVKNKKPTKRKEDTRKIKKNVKKRRLQGDELEVGTFCASVLDQLGE